MFWTKKFRKRRLQTVMIFMMVTICALLMSGSMVILSSLEAPYKVLALETDAPELKVYPAVNAIESGKDWKGELEKLAGVEKVIPVDRHFMEEEMTVGSKDLEVFISATVYQKELYEKVKLVDGDMTSLKEGECFIPATLSNTQNIALGDTITFHYGDNTFDYKVKAIFADVYALNTSYQMEVLIKELPKQLLLDPYYAVYMEKGKTGADAVEAYLESHEGLLDGNFYTREHAISNAHVTENILGAILFGLSVVIFLVTSVMIRYMIKNAMIRDTKTIAIYKAIGYTDQNIRGIYISFYQSIVLAGTIVGVLASPLITNAFMRAAFANMGKTQTITGIWQGLVCILIINCFVGLQVFLELKKIAHLKPAELFSGTDNGLGLKKEKFVQSKKRMRFSPFSMALRMIKRDKKNTAMIILTCFLSVYLVNMAIVCFDNIGAMANDNYYWLGFDKHDVTIQNSGDLERFYEIVEELKEDKKVKAIVKRNLDADFAIPYEESVVAMIYETYDNLEFSMVEGRNPQNADEIVIGNLYAKKMHKEIGDYIDIFLDANHKKSMLIVGTCQGFYGMGRAVRVRGDLMTENDMSVYYPEASILLENDVDAEQFVENFNETYENEAKAIHRKDLYANIISEITDPQEAALGPFIILALLIGTLNLIYIIYLKNLNNRKIYSIYRSIGYPVSHLIQMNCFYVGIIAVLSIVVAVPVFMFCFPKQMVLAMSMFGFAEYGVTYRASLLLFGNLGVIIVFLLGVLISSRDLYKNHIEMMVAE